jgi:MFS transporter, PPP family, 3-phenylpropionic acid transporter
VHKSRRWSVGDFPILRQRFERVGLTEHRSKDLFREPVFRSVVLVAALILGSHAMHDTFAVIRWTGAGITPQAAGVVWSLSVAAEVFVFFVAGPWLLRVLTPAGAIALAAVAAAGRWLIAAFTADLVALILTQPLCAAASGLHASAREYRACSSCSHSPGPLRHRRRGRGDCVGWLYAGMGPRAFAVMSVLCLLALPLAAGLRHQQEPAR